MARANLNKSGNIVKILPQHQSKYLRCPKHQFKSSLSDQKVPLNVNIVKQGLLDEDFFFENFMKLGLKGGF